MQLPDSRNRQNIAYIENHPTQVEKRIHEVALDSTKIQFGINLNDLEKGREVQARTILQCLREGSVDPKSLEIGGKYVRGIIKSVICGCLTEVEFFLGPGVSGLSVVNAYADEEE